MSSQPSKEKPDSHRRPLLPEPLSSRYKLCESDFTSPSWPSSPQDTHPALPLLEMPEEKVRKVDSKRFLGGVKHKGEEEEVKEERGR